MSQQLVSIAIVKQNASFVVVWGLSFYDNSDSLTPSYLTREVFKGCESLFIYLA